MVSAMNANTILVMMARPIVIYDTVENGVLKDSFEL